jgi:putative hemolysin
MTFASGVFGIYQIRLLGNLLFHSLSLRDPNPYLLLWCYVLAALAGVFFFVALGVIAPQKIAARRPEEWLFRLAGLVRVLLYILWPYAYLAEKASNLAVRLVGIDPTASFDGRRDYFHGQGRARTGGFAGQRGRDDPQYFCL